MARIQTLRSSLLVLRARNSSGCARSRATRPRPRGRAPAHGARPAPGCPAPGPAEWSPPRRPGTSRRRRHLAGRARSTRERAPLGTPERELVLVLPGRDRRGAPTEVSVGASASTSALSTPTWLRRVSGCAADRRADASSRSGRAKPRAEPRHQAVPSRHGPGQWPRTDYVRFPQCGLVIEGQGSKLHGHQRLGVRPITSRWGLRSRSPGCDSNASARVRAAATSDGS